jgi:methylmalonyl-CoA/ethylmalonyl-CoA epimerase
MISKNQPLFNINRAQQVAFVVFDVDKTIERLWNIFGIGPWQIDIRDYKSTLDNAMIKDMMYHKKPGRFSYKMAETTLGPDGFILEYIQPLSGENIYTDFLREHGEGMHHIGWHIVNTAEEFNRVTSVLEEQGFPCLQSARVYASQMAYFDTTSVLNTLLEVSFRDPTKKRPPPHAIYPNLKAGT